MNIRVQSAGVALGFLLATVLVEAKDWAQFRGPNASGRSSEKNIPVEWSDSENVSWQTKLPGPGSSSPIVSQGKVFITSYSGYGVDRNDPGEPDDLARHVICLDASNGKILWQREVPARLPEDPYRGYISEHGYASSTPVADGERVFVFFGKTGALAFDYAGKELWRTGVGQESSNRRWGSAASPIVHGDLVIVNASDESQSIRALEKKSGKEVWKAEASSLELAYGTPLVVPGADGNDELVISVPEEVWGLSPQTGKLTWYAATNLPGNICPTLTLADGIIYGSGGYPSQGSFAVRAGGKGDSSRSHVLWKSRVSSYVASPLAHEDHLYWVSDRGEATCVLAKDGSLVYRERLPNLADAGRQRAAYASLVFADGLLYAVSRYSGTYVLQAKPSLEVVAHNQFRSDSSQFNGTPAIADGKLYLRSDQYLYCIGKEGR